MRWTLWAGSILFHTKSRWRAPPSCHPDVCEGGCFGKEPEARGRCRFYENRVLLSQRVINRIGSRQGARRERVDGKGSDCPRKKKGWGDERCWLRPLLAGAGSVGLQRANPLGECAAALFAGRRCHGALCH